MRVIPNKVGHPISINCWYVVVCLWLSVTVHNNNNNNYVECITRTQGQYVTLKIRFGNLLGTVENIESANETFLQEQNGTKTVIQYVSFKGLPYAEPPVGNLRWKDPIVKESLPASRGYYNATKSGSPCPQWSSTLNGSTLIGNEDCLYADVYIPLKQMKQNDLFKIMVFFHGGGFIKNSNRNMIPTPLLLQENVIIIMFNYRVSIFGYLSTGTKELQGNFGSLDQIALLKWIQLNARDFGGDANHVTLFGSSIGGVSIHFLMLSKLASGLFNRAIIQSGSALCERSLAPNPYSVAAKLGSLVGCQASSPAKLTQCLRVLSTKDLMIAAKSLTTDWVLPTVLAPVIDRQSRPLDLQFLPDFPENLRVVNKVPVIVGVTMDEGLTAFVFLTKTYTFEQMNNLGFIETTILPKYLDLIMRARARSHTLRSIFIKSLAQQVMQLYKKEFHRDPISTLTGILGDVWIHSCYRKTLESFCSSNVDAVFPYLFTHHDSGVSPSEIRTQIEELHRSGVTHPILDNGVAHTEENLYLMLDESEARKSINILSQNMRNKLMSEILSSIWTSFANDENPDLAIPGTGLTGHAFTNYWPQWNPVCRAYNFTDPDFPLYEISLNNHRIFKNYRSKETQFWWNMHLQTMQEM